MREECSKLRRYALSQRPAGSAIPPPILFEGDSGDGKSVMAIRFANWLLVIRPEARRSRAIERLPLSDLAGRDQNARITIFGQGKPTSGQEPRRPSRETGSITPSRTGGQEPKDTAGDLHIPGHAQRAHGGILIVEEMGNADGNLHSMLLNFLDTGIARPEFPKPNAEEVKLDV